MKFFKRTKALFLKKCWLPLLRLIKQGVTPEKLAITVDIAILLGITPIMGPITIIATFISIRLKLNLPAMLGVLYLMYPVQIALFLPFIRLGGLIFQMKPLPFDHEKVIEIFENATWLEIMHQLGSSIILGMAAWAIVAVPLGIALYYCLIPFFRWLQQRHLIKQHD